MYNDKLTEDLLTLINEKNIIAGSIESDQFVLFCTRKNDSVAFQYPRHFETTFSHDELIALCLQKYFEMESHATGVYKDILAFSAS